MIVLPTPPPAPVKIPKILRGLVVEGPGADHLERAATADRIDQFKSLAVVTHAHDHLAAAEFLLERLVHSSEHLLDGGDRLTRDLAVLIENLTERDVDLGPVAGHDGEVRLAVGGIDTDAVAVIEIGQKRFEIDLRILATEIDRMNDPRRPRRSGFGSRPRCPV